jgi:hypothetical protein
MAPGESIRRVELHERFGGRRQGGISPSKVTPNVFLFTDPTKGLLHGYLYDGWREDGLFHYTGEGQHGDQQMAQGNRAIRDHLEEGRALHLFEVSKGLPVYVDEFEFVDDYPADAPETGNGPIRSVIVFRLRPKHAEPGATRSKVDLLGADPVKEVPVEQHLTESMLIEPTRDPYEAERREQKLVQAYLAYLIGGGHEVCRLQFRPDNEPAPIFCDLYDKTTNTVYEAKGSVARPAIRMAIGQLADYARLVQPSPSRAILVPQEPRADLLDLAGSQGITVVWPDSVGFASSDAASRQD